MKRHYFLLCLIIGFATMLMYSTPVSAYESETALDVGFSVIRITSENDPFTMPREEWQNGTISLESEIEGFSFDDADVRIRGRGNSTWWFGEEKRPLRLRFASPKALLNSGTEHRDWILLANHFDRSLLRNHTALHLGSLLSGLDNTPRSNFIHLYINGEYVGVYQLTDERNIDVGRTPLELDPDPTISEYMLEMDGRLRYEPDEEWVSWVSVNRVPYEIRFPADDISTAYHVEYVYNYLSRVSRAIRNRNFAALQNLIDIPSFVDFFLVQEFVKNPDVGWSSVFMSIRNQGDARRLYMGPLWDFDIAAGNSYYQATSRWATEIEQGYSPYGLTAANRNYWFAGAMQMPEFAKIVANRWQEISNNEIYQTIHHIKDVATQFASDFERNFERHEIMGSQLWQEPQGIIDILTFSGQVEHLVNWLERRAAWLDQHFNTILESQERSASPMISIDGVILESASPPFIINGIMLTPLSAIIYALDVYATWQPETRTIILSHPDDYQAILTIGETEVLVIDIDGNERIITLDIPAMIRNNHTFVPIRFVAEFLGMGVEWDRVTRTAVITRDQIDLKQTQ